MTNTTAKTITNTATKTATKTRRNTATKRRTNTMTKTRANTTARTRANTITKNGDASKLALLAVTRASVCLKVKKNARSGRMCTSRAERSAALKTGRLFSSFRYGVISCFFGGDEYAVISCDF